MKTFNENFYTEDYDQEMLDFIENNISRVESNPTNTQISNGTELVYGNGLKEFWVNKENYTAANSSFNKLTKEEFKRKIGMPTKEIIMENETLQEQATFGKKDLVDGMFVKIRNGEIFLKLGNNLNNLKGYLEFSGLDEQLLDAERDEEWDIVEVFSPEEETTLASYFRGNGLTSIWKRTPPRSEKVIKLEKLILMHEEQLEATKKLLEEELAL